MAKVKKSKLSKEKILFCQEFIKHPFPAEACVKAGFSIDSAEEIAYEYIMDPDVLCYISKLFDERIQQCFLETKKEIERIKIFYFKKSSYKY